MNRAVALAETGQLGPALDLILGLAPMLDAYQPFHAARAEYLARAGQTTEARAAYDRAIALTTSHSDATFLREKRNAL